MKLRKNGIKDKENEGRKFAVKAYIFSLILSIIIVVIFLNLTESFAENEYKEAEGAKIAVEEAKTYLGVKYKRAGVSRGGIDCTGLIYRAYEKAGRTDIRGYIPSLYERLSADNVKIENTNREQDISHLLPGDIIFWVYGKKTGHVALYIGDGEIIHATQSKGVHIRSLFSNGYTYNHKVIKGVKRVFQEEGLDLDERIEKVNEKKQKTYDKYVKLSKEVDAKEEKLEEIRTDIKDKEEKAEDLRKEIEEERKSIEERDNGLRGRVRNMYKVSSVGYLDVLFSSRNISEFMNNIDMLSRIFRHDKETLDKLVKRKAMLEAKEAMVKVYIERVEKNKEKKESEKKKLDKKKRIVQEEYEKIKEEEEEIMAEVDSIVEAGELEINGRLLSLAKDYKGKGMMTPVSGYTITGRFMEQRSYEKHPGIDLALSSGSPVHAAASGTVIRSGWYGGYGNCVIIAHGSGLTTLYGHNSKLKCKVGEEVKKGDVISLIGSTGWSTGPHLHFEVRKDGKLLDPSKFISIRGY